MVASKGAFGTKHGAMAVKKHGTQPVKLVDGGHGTALLDKQM